MKLFLIDTESFYLFSSNRNWLVTGSKDKTCRVWNMEQMTCVALGVGHIEAVGSIAMAHGLSTYQAHQGFVVTGGGDKMIKRWALPIHLYQTQQRCFVANAYSMLSTTHTVRAHEKDLNCLSVSPNDQIIASASQDKLIKIWSHNDLSLIATLAGHKRGVWKIKFSPVDRTLISCSGDRTVKIWSLSDFIVLKTLEGHTASVLNITYLDNGLQMISSTADGLLRLWSLRSGECESTLEDIHQDRVWALQSMPRNSIVSDEVENHDFAKSYFFSGGSDGQLIIWKDVTIEEESERLNKAEEFILLEQQLANDVKHGRFKQAILKAISLNQPSKVLSLFSSLLDDCNSTNNTQYSSLMKEQYLKLDDVISFFTDEETRSLLEYIKDWNTNAKNTFTTQMILQSIFRKVKVGKLLTWKSIFYQDIEGWIGYSDRHYQRIQRLSQASHMIDFVISQISLLPMESLDALNQSSGSVNIVTNDLIELHQNASLDSFQNVDICNEVQKSRRRGKNKRKRTNSQ
jgi:U3 small nucleolar RNA-associated protein 13